MGPTPCLQLTERQMLTSGRRQIVQAWLLPGQGIWYGAGTCSRLGEAQTAEGRGRASRWGSFWTGQCSKSREETFFRASKEYRAHLAGVNLPRSYITFVRAAEMSRLCSHTIYSFS